MDNDQKKLDFDKQIQLAKDDTFNLLSYRERSQAEIKKRLIKKGYDDNIIQIVISRLTELNYLNDQRFAEKWVKTRIIHKPRGRNLLKKELSKKGINRNLINKVLDNLLTNEVELKMGLKVSRKWLKSHHQFDLVKLQRFLQNKGFSYYLINQVLQKLNLHNSDSSYF